MKKTLASLLKKTHQSSHYLHNIIDAIRQNTISDIEIASFISLLTAKGVDLSELFYLITELRPSPLIELTYPSPTIDIVGTGGDGSNTLNISTVSSILVASHGIKVAKHGNRSVSSKCGSADLLLNWGIPLTADTPHLLRCLEATDITFFSAPHYNPIMKKIGPIRKTLGFPTCFNKLGPFITPYNVTTILLGVADPLFLADAVSLLQLQGFNRAIVVHCCGLDEFTTIGRNEYYELDNGIASHHYISPNDVGFKEGKLEDLIGDDADFNKKVLTTLLKGDTTTISSTLVDTICLNVGVALYLVGEAKNIKDGCYKAKINLLEGNGYKKLVEWQEFIRR